MTRKKLLPTRFRLFHLLHQLLSRVHTSRQTQPRNSTWALHSQAKPFWKIARYFTTPTRSVPPLFEHDVQVFRSADTAGLLAQHFEWTHHLNINVGTTKPACAVNRTVNKYFRRPNPHVTEAQLTNPYELRRPIQPLKTKSAPGTDVVSATMLRNLSCKALNHLTQIFNHILRFGYFP